MKKLKTIPAIIAKAAMISSFKKDHQKAGWKKITCLILFLACLSWSVKAQVTINTPRVFTDLVGPDGIFTVTGNLTITGAGSITGHPSGGSHMKIKVTGDLIMDSTATITGDINLTNKKADSITIWATNITLKGWGNGTNGAKITSNLPMLGSCSGGKGGNIYINATGDISTEKGSVISANAICSAGEIVLLAPSGKISIDGLVQSKSNLSGIGVNQPPAGGPIKLISSCLLHIDNNGKVSSEGGDGGADLVHLEACQVKVWGLVQSTGAGHVTPTNPKTHLVFPNRPDKPNNSTAGVEIWGDNIIINKTSPHKGEVNANLTTGAGCRNWIDILARHDISILGAATGNFAVHANNGGNDPTGGIVTVKSMEGHVTASGLALQASCTIGGSDGGVITVHSKLDINISDGKIQASAATTGGTPHGGKIFIQSFGTALPNTGNIITNTASNLNVTGGKSPDGTITLTACGAFGFPAGTITPASIIATKLPSCGGDPSLASQLYVNLPAADCLTTCNPCICIDCDDMIIGVYQNVTVDFNTTPPTYTGPAVLQPYFSASKVGADPSKWKAIFNLGSHRLVILKPAIITVSQVNGYAPGIEINSTCEVVVEKGATIKTITSDKKAGDIVINANGTVIMNGELRSQVTTTIGLPGAINVISKCGNMDVGGLVQILGNDEGGNTISLVTCKSDCTPSPFTGDITIWGLVKSYAAAHTGDLTLNRPNIRVVSMNGSVKINADTDEPLYDEFSAVGGKYDIYGGLLSWVTANANPGTIKVQAWKDVIVNGHGIDPTGPVYTSFGAIAAIATASSQPGGTLDIRSLNGKIIGNDRAFDVCGRNLRPTNFAQIMLNAKDNIELNRVKPGPDVNFNPVVNAKGVGVGDKGGKNDLRSYSGSIIIGTNVVVTAAVPPGQGSIQGKNNFTACTGVSNNGTVTPPPTIIIDCSTSAPGSRYTNCPDIGSEATTTASRTVGSVSKPSGIPATILLPNYPNPFSRSTTISYILAKPGFVTLKVFNALGIEVATIVSADQAAGEHHYQWNSANRPSGVYYARLKAGGFSGINKLVLSK